MEGMTSIVEALSKGWTPGGVGIWVIVATMMVGWWKGLPPVLDAWSNSVAREREHREKEISRLEAQIVASDSRHSECMEGQAKLRAEIAEQNKTISALVIQIRQMQLSGAGLTEVPPTMASIISRMTPS